MCFRLQEALAKEVTCYRMAHAEEEGPGEALPLPPPQEQQQQQQQDAVPVPGEAGPSEGAPPHPLGHIVFLYKLVEGVAPASYGLNVARMAQLPPQVLQRAAAVAAQVQAAAEARRRGAVVAAEQDLNQGGQAALVRLAADCRQFLCGALASGQVDGEAGRRLQQRVRELLALQGSNGADA